MAVIVSLRKRSLQIPHLVAIGIRRIGVIFDRRWCHVNDGGLNLVTLCFQCRQSFPNGTTPGIAEQGVDRLAYRAKPRGSEHRHARHERDLLFRA
jgi:hypothetical protein